MRNVIAGFLRDENGATAIEYALITALIGTGLIFVLQSLGQTVAGLFTNIGHALDDVVFRMR